MPKNSLNDTVPIELDEQADSKRQRTKTNNENNNNDNNNDDDDMTVMTGMSNNNDGGIYDINENKDITLTQNVKKFVNENDYVQQEQEQEQEESNEKLHENIPPKYETDPITDDPELKTRKYRFLLDRITNDNFFHSESLELPKFSDVIGSVNAGTIKYFNHIITAKKEEKKQNSSSTLTNLKDPPPTTLLDLFKVGAATAYQVILNNMNNESFSNSQKFLNRLNAFKLYVLSRKDEYKINIDNIFESNSLTEYMEHFENFCRFINARNTADNLGTIELAKSLYYLKDENRGTSAVHNVDGSQDSISTNATSPDTIEDRLKVCLSYILFQSQAEDSDINAHLTNISDQLEYIRTTDSVENLNHIIDGANLNKDIIAISENPGEMGNYPSVDLLTKIAGASILASKGITPSSSSLQPQPPSSLLQSQSQSPSSSLLLPPSVPSGGGKARKTRKVRKTKKQQKKNKRNTKKAKKTKKQKKGKQMKKTKKYKQ